MRYLLAIVEQGTSIDQLRTLGDHKVIECEGDEPLDAATVDAMAELSAEQEWGTGKDFEFVRIPLVDAERLYGKRIESVEIIGRIGPV